MKTTIITIGDEILNGTTVDTNSAWMALELNKLGIDVYEILSVEDEESHILNALKRAEDQSDIVLITGGLGPTKDDITKKTLATYFGSTLKIHQPLLDLLEEYFTKRGYAMLESNKALALLPDNCTPIRNNKGTAWAMWFEANDTVFVSMPGVPSEMKAIMQDEVLDRIQDKYDLSAIVHRHILTAGVGESYLADKMEDFENGLPPHIRLAYLPGLGTVKLRLTARGEDEAALLLDIDEQVEKLKGPIGRYIYGYDGDGFEQKIGELLLQARKTISTAESCTGGYIAHRITMVAGSSRYYHGSAVTYSNDMKCKMLGVQESTLKAHGAVSEEVVIEMLQGVTSRFETDYGIAVSGVAGPSGGSDEKPVGTVWVAVGSPDNIKTKRFNFPGTREINIKLTGVVALEMFRKYLLRHQLENTHEIG